VTTRNIGGCIATILFVDDEAMMLCLYTNILPQREHCVITAPRARIHECELIQSIPGIKPGLSS
jgi:hypothetical protein